MPNELETTTVILHIAYVGHGGNGADGKYFYSYTPSFVPVYAKDTKIEYILHDDSETRYQIFDFAINDPGDQIFDAQIDKQTGNFSMRNKCTEDHQLILLSILVKDTQTGAIIDCDPQVTNVPPPE